MQEPIDIKKLDKRILEQIKIKNQIVSDQIMNTFFTVLLKLLQYSILILISLFVQIMNTFFTVFVNCYSTRKIVTLIYLILISLFVLKLFHNVVLQNLYMYNGK